MFFVAFGSYLTPLLDMGVGAAAPGRAALRLPTPRRVTTSASSSREPVHWSNPSRAMPKPSTRDWAFNVASNSAAHGLLCCLGSFHHLNHPIEHRPRAFEQLADKAALAVAGQLGELAKLSGERG